MKTLSLRARLTLWYSVVLVAVLGLFAVDVLIVQQRIGIQRVDRELDTTHAQLTNMLREELRELDTPQLAAQESRNVIAAPGREIMILDDGGRVLATKLDALNVADVVTGGAPVPGAMTLQTKSGPWRVHVRREAFEGAAMLLVVASPMTDLARDQREVREAVFLGIPIALVLAGAGGLWLASIGLRPLTTMARRAASIPSNGLEDLGEPVRNDELGQMTRAFNGLVARLRSALQTQRQFMADASHELRSPVSVIRAASEVALGREHRTESEYREALGMTGTQARRLSALVDDMLVLARADAGGYPLRPVDLYLDDVLVECQRAIGMLANERRITVTSTGGADAPIRGDEELLRRLIVNLLQNAVEFTRPGGAVAVDVRAAASAVCVRVTDSGPGIPEEARNRIFDRFVRLDPSRRSEGAGLGLTIAKWIAEVHQGSLTLESSGPHGSTFCLTLPVKVSSEL
jgi:two-component system, OmpR family, heavy metal sensor histidine kinase CusS